MATTRGGTGDDRRFLWRWTLATFVGWILGVFGVVLLSAAGGLVRVGDQWAIGPGMALGVGLAQWPAARKRFGAGAGWMWAPVLGMAIPFIISDVLHVWRGDRMMPLVLANVLVGAALGGAWQSRTLRSRSRRPAWWIPAWICGWIVAGALPFLLIVPGRAGSPSMLWRNLGAILSGGVALGIITGGFLIRLLRSGAAAARAPE